MMLSLRQTLFLCLALFCSSLVAQKPVLNIQDFGAVSDGKTLNSTNIQKCIDSCALLGGGIVRIPKGVFLSGSIRLRSKVELHLEEGAILLGSTRFEDYGKNNWYALILALGEHDIAISGAGVIDGQGAELAKDVDRLYKEGKLIGPYTDNRPHEQHRPQLIDLESCLRVKISGISLQNSSCWVQRYGRCEDLSISNIRVESTAYWNNDGIDLVDCKRVRIQHCNINAADDGICLKSDRPALACEDILIRDCTIRSSASAIKFGTNSYGGFKRININNIHIFNTFRSAIALEIVDGGRMEDVYISNVDARNTGNALFIRLGHRNQRAPAGTIRNIRIKNMTVEVPQGRPDAGYPFEGPAVKEAHNLFPSSIVGLPDHCIENVHLENIQVTFSGGGKESIASLKPEAVAQIPEKPKDYPEFSMFGELPAWALFARHVKGLKIKNCQFTLQKEDYRPAFVLHDVADFKHRRLRIRGDKKTWLFRN